MEIRPVAGGSIGAPLLKVYESVLAKLDSPQFAASVDEALGQIVPSARFYMYDWAHDRPVKLHLARYEPRIEPLVALYTERYLPTDPVIEAVKVMGGSGDAVLLRVLPSDIAQQGYREQFFHACDIVERLSLVQRTSAGWRALNISRDGRSGVCSDEELSLFVGIGQLLLPMVSRHERRIPVALPGRRSSAEMEARFAERCPQLSRRERQVCARAAIGMSVEGTALDLDIAMTSVLTYRKRAYGRLSVSSPYELACLVMR